MKRFSLTHDMETKGGNIVAQLIPKLERPGSSVGIATGYGLDGPGIESWWGARFSAPVQTSPGAHPASSTMGTGSFLGVKSGRGVTLTPHPLLVPWSWKVRAIPLLPLWAVRPVHSLSACTRVHFTYLNSALRMCCKLRSPAPLQPCSIIRRLGMHYSRCGLRTQKIKYLLPHPRLELGSSIPSPATILTELSRLHFVC